MRAERARRGLSAKELARELGVSSNQIFRWELGEQEPSASNLLALANFYGCSPEYLLDITDNRKKQEIARA